MRACVGKQRAGDAKRRWCKHGARTHLRVQLRFFKIDRWDNEWAYVTVDGVHVWSRIRSRWGKGCSIRPRRFRRRQSTP